MMNFIIVWSVLFTVAYVTYDALLYHENEFVLRMKSTIKGRALLVVLIGTGIFPMIFAVVHLIVFLGNTVDWIKKGDDDVLR